LMSWACARPASAMAAHRDRDFRVRFMRFSLVCLG
jgi:hypothetical protein